MGELLGMIYKNSFLCRCNVEAARREWGPQSGRCCGTLYVWIVERSIEGTAHTVPAHCSATVYGGKSAEVAEEAVMSEASRIAEILECLPSLGHEPDELGPAEAVSARHSDASAESGHSLYQADFPVSDEVPGLWVDEPQAAF